MAAVPGRRRQPRDVRRRHRPGDARDPAVARVPLPHRARPCREQRHDHADAAGAGDQPVVPRRRGPARSALQTAMTTLGTPDGRETQVRRLLGVQAGRDRMVRVVREWLGVDRITETAKDTTVYSRFTTAARTSIDTETKKFIDEVVQQLDRDGRRAAERELEHRRQHAGADLRRHLRGRDRAHEPAQAPRHPEPGRVPVGVRARAGDGARASRRRGHAPGRVHEAP